jgi:hypothetical protein
MPHAIGGVLDDWNFIVNIAVAVGTIAAAAAAVWLGLRASGEKQRDRRDAARWNARQIISALQAWVDWGDSGPFMAAKGPALEIVNGSTEAVTDVRAELTMEPLGDPPAHAAAEGITWQWRGHAGPRLDYLLPGQSDYLPGTPVNAKGETPRLLLVRPFVTVRVMISWQDGHGTYWARYDNGEPFLTSGAYPGRQLGPGTRG